MTFPTAFETTISEFLGVGKDMVLNREVLQPDVLKMTLSISESGTGQIGMFVATPMNQMEHFRSTKGNP